MRNPPPLDRTKQTAAGTVHDPGMARRWALQRKAQGILSDKAMRENRHGVTVAHFEFRVAMCHRATDGGPVAIKRSADRMHARYAGVQTCGSVWHCPICAPKVAGERREEMNEAIAAHVQEGGEVYFLTSTFSHDAETFGAGNLGAALDALAAARSRFTGSRAYRSTMEAAGALGAIRALEPTFGEMNGWHPHTHELVFGRPGMARLLLRRLRKLWARELLKRGLGGLRPGDIGADRRRRLRHLLAHCFTVQPGDYAAEYVAKFGREPERDRGAWGIGSEMTRSHLKRGAGAGAQGVPQRCEHVTPWGLLNDALDGDKRSAELFREYAIAFQGRRQLLWSPGLKKHFFGTVGRSDEEIAATDARCTEHVCEVGPVSWARVLEHNARFDLLRAAAIGGAQGVHEFLEKLERAPPGRFSGEYVEGRAVFLRRAA